MKLSIGLVLVFVLLWAGYGATQKCKSLKIEYCSSLGYNMTYYKNLVDEADQQRAQNDINFKDLLVLDGIGCSKMIKPLACSIYAPPCLEKYGALPPCRSFCEAARKSCRLFIRAYKSIHGRGAFYCDLFPKADPVHGCIDWTIQNGKYVMKIKGTPTMMQYKKRHVPYFLKTG